MGRHGEEMKPRVGRRGVCPARAASPHSLKLTTHYTSRLYLDVKDL